MASGAFNPYSYLDKSSQNTTGRGGVGTSLGGQSFLGSAPGIGATAQVQAGVPMANGRKLFGPRAMNVLRNQPAREWSMGGSMGRDDGRRISARPTFLNSDAFFNARGSGLDYLEDYGPKRGSENQANPLGAATYGGQPAASNAFSSVGGNISGSPAVGPVSSANDYTPEGRRTRMGLEQQALMAQGLAEGKAAVNSVQQAQNALPTPSGASIVPVVGGNGPGSELRSRYGTGLFSQLGGGPRSFGATRASSPEQSRQNDLGESAIAAVQRRVPGTTQGSLIDSYYRRFGRR